MLARLVSHGARGVAVRRLGGTRAGEIRITRFLRNPSVTPQEMTATVFARCQAACAGRDVLAVQDTTVTRSSGGGGDYLHAMIAVLVFGETIEAHVALGAGIIVVAGLFTFWRERARARKLARNAATGG